MSITSPARAASARPRSAAGARRVLLLLHLAMGLGWLGVTSAFVVLTVWLLDVRDPATVRTGYLVHELLVVWVARPAAIGVAATGMLLALTAGRRRAPRWWLWWVPAKLALVVATVVVTVSVSPAALRFAVGHADTVGSPAYTDIQHALVLVAIYHVAMITAAALLAISRPGTRFRSARRSAVAP
ncbi:hypothetical protein [Actinomycetospora sp. NBC_00405]|uniref:hypothetical protein n=1 Tax=Actinomycetospora sp. NBC_00405 TaxID=2975952 RepID=UPI002E23B5D5